MEKTLYSTSMQHDMPQSLLVIAVSFTPETPNFGTFGGVAYPALGLFIMFLKKLPFNCVYTHI